MNASLLSEGQYLRDAQEAALPAALARRSWQLYLSRPHPRAPGQPQPNLVLAYQDALRHAPTYQRALEDFGLKHGAAVRFRPSGIKDANRAIEKMRTTPTLIPSDLLAGTVIADTLEGMYALAEHLHAAFNVVSFRDRMIRRVQSGYGDLQCLVSNPTDKSGGFHRPHLLIRGLQ